MKKLKLIFYCNVSMLLLVLMLVGCADTKEQSKTVPSENDPVLKSEGVTDEAGESKVANGEKSTTESEKPAMEASNNTSSEEKTSESKADHPLAKYSSEQIEYARVWLQLGPNQDIDALNVRHIPAGSPLDPDDDNSLSYPENVIRLTGTRIVDGIVTYSSNGNGTINVYNVPLRWYGGTSRPDDIDEDKIQEEMDRIIKDTKLVHVNPGDDEKIIKIINKINIQS